MSASTLTYRYVHQIEFNHNGKLYSCDFLSTSDRQDKPSAIMMARKYLKNLKINSEGEIKIVSYTVVENKEES